MGNGEVLRPGEFQRMTAGTGIPHSEFNPSATEPVHLYQIWLLPDGKGLPPSYEQKAIRRQPSDRTAGNWSPRPTARRFADDPTGCRICWPICSRRQSYLSIEPGRHAWLQVLSGAIDLSGLGLSAGDGAAISEQSSLAIAAREQAEIMLFDLA